MPIASLRVTALTTLHDAGQAWLVAEKRRVKAKQIQQTTYENRRHSLRHLGDLASMPLGEITAGDLEDWLNDLASRPSKRGNGQGRAKLAADTVRSLLSWAVRRRALQLNPMREVLFRYQPERIQTREQDLVRLRVDFEATLERRRKRRLSGIDLAAWLAGVCAALLILGTGCRCGEARHARVEDWDPATLQVRLLASKDHRRAVAVPPALAPMLDELVSLVGTGFLFPSCNKKRRARGEPITEITVWRTFSKAGKRLGIDVRVFPHLSRHGLARDSLRRGATPEKIAEALGNSVAVVRRHYIRGEETPDGRALVEAHADRVFGRREVARG